MTLQLDGPEVASLAQRMAQRIEHAPDILRDLGIPIDAYKKIAATPYFRRLLDEATRAWGSPENIQRRITAKAEVALELALPHMVDIAQDTKAPPAARVGAYKEMRSLTRIGQPEAANAGNPKERFTLNIILEPGAAAIVSGHSGVTLDGEVEEREPEPWEEASDPPPETVPAPPPRRLTREETFERTVAGTLKALREEW